MDKTKEMHRSARLKAETGQWFSLVAEFWLHNFSTQYEQHSYH